MSAHRDPSREPTTTGVAEVTEYLDGQRVPYEVLEHDPSMTAAAEADATHRPQQRVAKTVVLQETTGYVLAIVPASERLDLHKLRELLGATTSLRLATEDEMARDFPTIEVGATPPVGPALPRAEVVDRRLLEEDRIVCPAGDHRHSVLLDPRDVVRVAGAEVADICVD
jgi:Ala-tRNA(Pro) deacylase